MNYQVYAANRLAMPTAAIADTSLLASRGESEYWSQTHAIITGSVNKGLEHQLRCICVFAMSP
ncbi:hypothetical protein FHS27_006244 [Rhodopirellula rubra]|uniref:Uncharacterized protein n=1 Tax=Aporhodopirellula rubra TaxID=980271 RepID=A0A7W5H874_9BACT|nr:hypothetical protein [Aporhodopirellula rubra]MBB3210397.1 hypothetical protein [Aporhodopirellula rubra]